MKQLKRFNKREGVGMRAALKRNKHLCYIIEYRSDDVMKIFLDFFRVLFALLKFKVNSITISAFIQSQNSE